MSQPPLEIAVGQVRILCEVERLTFGSVNRRPTPDPPLSYHEAWKKIGSPPQPSPEQYAQLEAAGRLQSVESPRWTNSAEGRLRLNFDLPLHGVSLILVTW